MDESQHHLVSHSAKKLNALTSLRFIAAAMIVLGHCHGEFGRTSRIAEYFALNQAVSFFFVLSGFILVYVYPELNSSRDRGRFLLARVARIWPAHAASFVLLLILAPMTLRPSIRDSIPWVVTANLLMVQSWIPLWNYFLSFNGVSWSISTEFFFYLCYPFLIYRWHQTWFRKLLLSFFLLLLLITISNALHLPNTHWVAGLTQHALVYISPLARLFEFVVGMTVALAWRHTSRHIPGSSVSGSILEVLAVALAVASTHYTPALAYLPAIKRLGGEAGTYWIASSGSVVVFGLLIFVMALEKGWISKLLSWPIAVLLGEISYSVYLVHSVLLRFYQYYRITFTDIPGWLLYILYWMLVLIISHLIWLFIECPCRKAIVGFWPETRNADPVRISSECMKAARFPFWSYPFRTRSRWAVIFEVLFLSSVSLMVFYGVHWSSPK